VSSDALPSQIYYNNSSATWVHAAVSGEAETHNYISDPLTSCSTEVQFFIQALGQSTGKEVNIDNIGRPMKLGSRVASTTVSALRTTRAGLESAD